MQLWSRSEPLGILLLTEDAGLPVKKNANFSPRNTTYFSSEALIRRPRKVSDLKKGADSDSNFIIAKFNSENFWVTDSFVAECFLEAG